MFCKQTVSAEFLANFHKFCVKCSFMENFFTRKLCENAGTLQGVRFLLGKRFEFANSEHKILFLKHLRFLLHCF